MRLIDADALLPMMKYATIDSEIGVFPIKIGFNTIAKVIDDAPTVDAEPVRHGKWVGAESQCGIGCPFCGTPVDEFCASIDYINLIYEPNYCPNCGARMDGERKEE